MDANILAVKPGQLTAADKRLLRKNGIVVLEVDDPDSVRLINPASSVAANDLSLAALFALKQHGFGQAHSVFVASLYERLRANEEAIKQATP